MLALAALAASACGDDAAVEDAATQSVPSESATETNDTAEETPEETEDAAPDDASEVTEESAPADDDEAVTEPIVIGFIGATVDPIASAQALLGVEAGVQGVNAAGGIDGRPLELVSCDDEADPNLALECYNSLVDEGAVTFVGNFYGHHAAVGPAMAEDGFVTIGGFLLNGAEMAAPGFYATNGGTFVAGAGQGTACASVGASRIAAAYVDVEAGAQLIPLLEGVVLPAVGAELVESVPMPFSTADFAPIAAKLMESEPDCILGLSSALQITPLFQSLFQAGYEGRLVVSGASYSPASLVETFGDDAEGIVFPGLYDQSSAGWAQYQADLDSVEPGFAGEDISASSWLGVQIAADIMRSNGVERSAISAGIADVVSAYDTDGLTAASLNWSIAGENPLGLPLVNLRNQAFIPMAIEGGDAVAQGSWVDMWTGQPTS